MDARDYSQRMLAVSSSQGEIIVAERETPSGEGLLLNVHASGICGSDLHLVAAGLTGVTLGHEFGGRLSDGRLVAIRPTGACGDCPSCREGRPNICSLAVGDLHGSTLDGGLADFVLVQPDRVVEMPHGFPEDLVALVEPTAVAVHGVGRSAVEPGMSTLVVGAGSIGLLTVAVLVNRGIAVDIIARHPHQAAVAEALGARVVTTPQRRYEVCFDAVSTQQSLDSCISHTAPGGTIVEFGLIWAPVGLTNALLLKEISLVPTMFYCWGKSHNDFAAAAAILMAHPRIGEQLVTHRFPLSEAAAAFTVAADRASGAIKVNLFTTP